MPARAFGHEEDKDEEDFASTLSSRNDEHVVAFSSATGAEPARKRSRTENAPKVIPLTRDGDWMAERKRRLNLGRHAAQLGRLVSMQGRDGDGERGGSANQSRIGDGDGSSTLTPGLMSMRRVAPAAPSERTHAEEEAEMAALQAAARHTTPSASKAGDTPTDDDAEARAALLAGDVSSSSGGRGRDTERVIEMDETALTQADAANRPDAPTVEEYAALPISEFGAAMLRGMGWREGQGAGRNRQGPTTSEQVKKRPALLGLGAKERKEASGTSGASGASGTSRSKDAKRPSRPDNRYMPVVKRSAEEGSRSRQGIVSLGDRNDARHDSRRSEARSSRHRDEYDRERHSRERKGDRERYSRDEDGRYGSDRRDADWSSSRQDRDGYAGRER
ncbi:G PATCH AND KOW-CONTAINING [Ceraceosorus bombacis]|uniref:G PATCH AND KOW-CONTAINING n=1 Tax=Ceraceosorus bombacis TaxID=401625 RepID=A0A0P1BHI0_9BASI|nr:G PATCH AND KOW-CONTAINING [Ceraceosorus bombacis]